MAKIKPIEISRNYAKIEIEDVYLFTFIRYDVGGIRCTSKSGPAQQHDPEQFKYLEGLAKARVAAIFHNQDKIELKRQRRLNAQPALF